MFSFKQLEKSVILFILLYLCLIWIFPYLPLNDYSAHLASVHIINQILHGSSFLEEYVSFNLLIPAILNQLMFGGDGDITQCCQGQTLDAAKCGL